MARMAGRSAKVAGRIWGGIYSCSCSHRGSVTPVGRARKCGNGGQDAEHNQRRQLVKVAKTSAGKHKAQQPASPADASVEAEIERGGRAPRLGGAPARVEGDQQRV